MSSRHRIEFQCDGDNTKWKKSSSTLSLALECRVQFICRTVNPNIKFLSSILFLFLEIALSKWSQNPYFRGSWSDPVIDTDHTVYANMAGRIKNLFFGGEATHEDWHGFKQGAYYSGGERANEIASCIRGKKCETYQPFTGLAVIDETLASKVSSDKLLWLSPMFVAICLFCIVYNSRLRKMIQRKCSTLFCHPTLFKTFRRTELHENKTV